MRNCRWGFELVSEEGFWVLRQDEHRRLKRQEKKVAGLVLHFKSSLLFIF